MLHKDSDEARRQRARQGLAEGTCDLFRYFYCWYSKTDSGKLDWKCTIVKTVFLKKKINVVLMAN